MSLENLEKNLYRKNIKKKPLKKAVRGNIEKTEKEKPSNINTAKPWGDDGVAKSINNESRPISIFQKYGKIAMYLSIIFIVIMMGVSGYYLYQFFKSKDVNIAMNSPQNVLSGTVFNVSVSISNTSSKDLLNPIISLYLPDGSIYVGNSNKRVVEEPIDAILKGETVKKEFEVAIIGDVSKVYEFNTSVSYKYSKSSVASVFEAKSSSKTLVKSSVLAMNISAPEKVVNGEDFEVSLSYQNIGTEELMKPKIKFDIPKEFSIQGSDPKLENNEFVVNSMDSNSNGVAVFSGSIVSKNYTFFSISVEAQVNIGGKYYTVSKKTNSISISPSQLSISIEPQIGHSAVYPGDNIRYKVLYINNSDIVMHDVVLTAQLFGTMFDVDKLSSSGYFDKNNNTIKWTASEVPKLKDLEARSSGYIYFEVPLLSEYPNEKISDKNFTVKVKGKISSPTLLPGVSSNNTIGLVEVQNQVGGSMDAINALYFNDKSVNIKNNGSLPPTVGAPIEYTVHLSIDPKGADFKDVSASMFLSPGVSWTGKVISNIKTVPVYNDRTKEITWDVGELPCNAGSTGTDPSVVFQVVVTPSEQQVGGYINLVSRENISGVDVFTGNKMDKKMKDINSFNLSDDYLPDNYGRVIK